VLAHLDDREEPLELTGKGGIELMKKFVVLLLVLSAGLIFASQTSVNFSEPVLITSAGQSAGATMMKVLSMRAKLDFIFEKLATADMLENFKSLVIVVGASSKGLGSAGIDVDQEIERVTLLVEKARELGIPVIIAHIEGTSRRGPTSDRLLDLLLPYADLVIVTKSGNQDGKFTDFCQKENKPLVTVNTTSEVQGVLEDLYSKR